MYVVVDFFKVVKDKFFESMEECEVDFIMFSIFGYWFMVIVEQMGRVFQKISVSINVKECFDFFCVIFDVFGGFVVNVFYLFVYLGFMLICVCIQVKIWEGKFKKGDVIIFNYLLYGGIYLLDIIFLMLVFNEVGDKILFYVVFCVYYVDIGGIMVGSMFFYFCELY